MLVMGRSSEWDSGRDRICSEIEAWGLRAAVELADRMVIMGRACRVDLGSEMSAPWSPFIK